jgi:hypothetical protein
VEDVESFKKGQKKLFSKIQRRERIKLKKSKGNLFGNFVNFINVNNALLGSCHIIVSNLKYKCTSKKPIIINPPYA